MDVKSRVITEIDNLFSEYNEEKDKPLTPNMRGRRKAILGAISALEFLKGQVQGLDPDKFEFIHIVEKSESEIPTLRNPKGFLSRVLFSIEHAREYIRLDGRVGSGPDPDAVQGRNEACDRIRKFVCQLNSELVDN